MRRSVTMSARFITQLITKNNKRFHHHFPGQRSIVKEALPLTLRVVVVSGSNKNGSPSLDSQVLNDVVSTNRLKCKAALKEMLSAHTEGHKFEGK